VRQDGPLVIFKPVDFLGESLFSKYRQATSGARYDGRLKAQVAPITRSLEITKKLHDAGFTLDLPPELALNFQAKEGEVCTKINQAAVRADKVDNELQKRGLQLFPFQKVGVRWLASRSGALLADDMGLGKTMQALLAIPEGDPILVVGPAVAKNVWESEAKKWRPDLKVTVLYGRNSFRWPNPGELLILNYDILPSLLSSNPLGNTVLIADEAHALKSSKTIRGRNFRLLSGAVQKGDGKVWLLTATPLMNRPPELWSVLQAAGLAKEAFGSWDHFTQLFNAQVGPWGYEWGHPQPEVPELLQRVSLRRMKVDVLPDLPTKIYRDVVVSVSLKQDCVKKAYDKFGELLKGYTRYSRVNEDPLPSDVLKADLASSEGELLAKFGPTVVDAEQFLKQVNGTCFREIAKARAALATVKIPALLELVQSYEEQNEPLVVFSAHRAPIDKFIGREGWEVITGDTSPEDRVRIQTLFQSGKLKGVAGTIKAAGVALTLTHASNAIFVDLDWTPALNAQAEDRILRIGSTRGVLITTLVADNPLERLVHGILTQKRAVIKDSIEASSRTSSPEARKGISAEDLAAISQAAEDEREKEAAAQAAAETAAHEREKDREQQRRQIRFDRWTREAKETSDPRRFAQTSLEQWALTSLQVLAQLDPDRAAFKNDAGFSASDANIGHRFAYLASKVGLTEKEWGLAYLMCCKYRRQIGKPPEEKSSLSSPVGLR